MIPIEPQETIRVLLLAYSWMALVFFTITLFVAVLNFEKLAVEMSTDRDFDVITQDPSPLARAAKLIAVLILVAVFWPYSLYQVLK